MVQTNGYLRELDCREMGFSIGVWTLDPVGSPARTNKTPKRRRSIMRYTVESLKSLGKERHLEDQS